MSYVILVTKAFSFLVECEENSTSQKKLQLCKKLKSVSNPNRKSNPKKLACKKNVVSDLYSGEQGKIMGFDGLVGSKRGSALVDVGDRKRIKVLVEAQPHLDQ